MPKPRFLGTTAGTEALIWSAIKKELTYTRTYSPDSSHDPIRQTLSRGARYMQEIGANYTMVGGGYFLTLLPVNQFLSPASYAISQYGQQIEFISGLSLNVLQTQTDAYSIRYMIYHYFDSVIEPQTGDLVFYSKPMDKVSITPLVGIFQNTQPNWNSPPGGTVVAKYNTASNAIFQFDIFFTPNIYGDEATFYRLKTQAVPLELPYFLHPPSIPYRISNDLFISECVDLRYRQRLSITRKDLMVTFKQIETLDYIQFQGVCFDYAFGKFLGTYATPKYTAMLSKHCTIIKYFDTTIRPEKGDLAIYYCVLDNDPDHYGIYLEDDYIESKWGIKNVYRHPYFDVPHIYGDYLKFVKLKPGLSKEWFYYNIKLDHEGRDLNAPIVINKDANGYETLLLFSYRKPKPLGLRKGSSPRLKAFR